MTDRDSSSSAVVNAARPKGEPAQAVRLVKETLSGPVVEVFIRHVPGLRGLSTDKAYDLIMNNPDLADHCFKLFRSRSDLFAAIRVGPDNRPVTGDDQPLRCGRTTAQVVTLVVRAMAKRYFNANLAPPTAPPPRPGLLGRLAALVTTEAPAPGKAKPNRAESLYRAMDDILLYEWQVPLIPHYAPLPVALVRQLGRRLLDIREPARLRDLALNGMTDNVLEAGRPTEGPPPRRTALPAGTGPSGGNTARAEAMWNAAQNMKLGALFDIDEAELRTTIAHVTATGPLAMTALSAIGLRLAGAVAMLATMDRCLGHRLYGKMMGAAAEPGFLRALIDRARPLELAEMTDAAALKTATEELLDRLRAAGWLND